MATLLDIRKRFIERNGRVGLVADPYAATPDWSDRGANEFINEGQRTLDRLKRVSLDVNDTFTTTVRAGENSVTVPRLRILQACRLFEESGESIELERSTRHSLSDTYQKRLSAVAPGKPEYYAKTGQLLSFNLNPDSPEQLDVYVNALSDAQVDISHILDTVMYAYYLLSNSYYFNLADTNSSGTLSLAEIQALAVTVTDLSPINSTNFNAADTDDNGLLTLEEIIAYRDSLVVGVTIPAGFTPNFIPASDNLDYVELETSGVHILLPPSEMTIVYNIQEVTLEAEAVLTGSDHPLALVVTVTFPSGFSTTGNFFIATADYLYGMLCKGGFRGSLLSGGVFETGFVIPDDPSYIFSLNRIERDGTYTIYLNSPNPHMLLIVSAEEVTLSDMKLIPLVGEVGGVSVKGESVLIMPPADADYELEFEGQFYTQKLVNDEDESYWTDDEKSELLILAALYEHERSLRNDQGAKEWMDALKQKLAEIFGDVVEDEVDSVEGPLIIEG